MHVSPLLRRWRVPGDARSALLATDLMRTSCQVADAVRWRSLTAGPSAEELPAVAALDAGLVSGLKNGPADGLPFF